MKTILNDQTVFTVTKIEAPVSWRECWRCKTAAQWIVYYHGDPEPAGDYVGRSCSTHLGPLLRNSKRS